MYVRGSYEFRKGRISDKDFEKKQVFQDKLIGYDVFSLQYQQFLFGYEMKVNIICN